MLKKISLITFIALIISACSGIKDTRTQLLEALEDKDLKKVVHILDIDSNIKNLKDFRDSNEDNILHLIVEKNDIDAFRHLLNNNYILPYNHYNNQYNTPLGKAATTGKSQIAELLMIKGADPLIMTQGKPSILVQSMLAKQYTSMEGILLREGTLNQSSDGWTVMHYAAYVGDAHALEIIFKYHPKTYAKVSLEFGAPYYNQETVMNIGDINPFQLAIVRGNLAAAKILLQYYPTYLYTVSSTGVNNKELAQLSRSPSMMAWIEAVEPTLEKKRKKIKIKDPTTQYEKDIA